MPKLDKLRTYRVHRVGVELEGGWDERAWEELTIKGWHTLRVQVQHDGSVQTGAAYNQELVSPPLRAAEIPAWITPIYPTTVHESCGMHIHLSFRQPGYYAMLMEQHFFDFFKEKLKEWGTKANIRRESPFWPRVEGRNHFCRDRFTPLTQFWHKDKGPDRYTMLNYAWARYGTIECRVLPTFKESKVAIAAIEAVIMIFETYLSTFKNLLMLPPKFSATRKSAEEGVLELPAQARNIDSLPEEGIDELEGCVATEVVQDRTTVELTQDTQHDWSDEEVILAGTPEAA